MISRQVRAAILDRAGGQCERCGRSLDPYFYSLQHRRARGMGGSRRRDTNSPVNLVALCGSATTPGGCHQWVEAHPDYAIVDGWRVPQGIDPVGSPVRTWQGWKLLDADGTYQVVA